MYVSELNKVQKCPNDDFFRFKMSSNLSVESRYKTNKTRSLTYLPQYCDENLDLEKYLSKVGHGFARPCELVNEDLILIISAFSDRQSKVLINDLREAIKLFC